MQDKCEICHLKPRVISHLVTVLLSGYTCKKLSLVYFKLWQTKKKQQNIGFVVTFERLFILHNIGVAHVGENGHLFAGLLPFLARHLWKGAGSRGCGEDG